MAQANSEGKLICDKVLKMSQLQFQTDKPKKNYHVGRMFKTKDIERIELTVSFCLKREYWTFILVNLPPSTRIKFTGKECGEVNCFYFRNYAIIKVLQW